MKRKLTPLQIWNLSQSITPRPTAPHTARHIATILLLVVVLLLALLCAPKKASAEGLCNQFLNIRSHLLGEATNQSLETLIDIARVIYTKERATHPCFIDFNFFAAQREAHRLAGNTKSCLDSNACKAFFYPETFPEANQQRAALAAHIVLTENPPVARFHFDSRDSPLYPYWVNLRSCPNGYIVSGDFRIC